MVGDRSCAQASSNCARVHSVFQTNVKLRAGFGRGHVPEFRFWFAAQFGCDLFRRMNLERKFLVCIEQFYEQGKTRMIGRIAENFVSMLGPEFVQRFAFERAARDDTLRFGTIHQLPRFTDADTWRKLLAEFRFEPAPAPDSLHENRVEGEGSRDFELRHGGLRIRHEQTANVQRLQPAFA